MGREVKIGGTINRYGVKHVVVESSVDGCVECSFSGLGDCDDYKCMAAQRDDGKEIHFELADTPQPQKRRRWRR